MKEELKPYLDMAQYKYDTKQWYRTRCDYYNARKKYNIDDKTILYEAFYGRGITCNPGELFRYLLNDERFIDYTHVWVLEQSEFRDIIINELKNYNNVKFIEPFTEVYFEYLSKAKYLINNVTWQNYFTKKEGQVVINTWHGIPLKHLGYDVPNAAVNVSNIIRNMLFTDYILSPVPFTTDNFKHSFKLDGIYNGKIIETGYPRIDATINADKDSVSAELKNFGVSYDPGKKLILYAPTWRGEKYGNPDINIDEYDACIDMLYSHIDKNEYQVLFKPHQIVYKSLVNQGLLKDYFIPATVNTNALLGITDILISDYSSIFFDFLVTKKPILFYIPDLEAYQQERGLYFSVDDLPGPVSDNLEKIAEWTGNIENYRTFFDYSNYENAVSKFVCNDDGNVCKRVVDTIFFGDDSHAISLKNDKKKILFHLDQLHTNGITFSLLNLIRNLDYEKYDVSFYAIPSKNELDVLENIDKRTRILYRNSTVIINIEQDAKRFYSMDNSLTEMDNSPLFPREFYEIEYKRCFGDAKFDYIINFGGYSGFWANIYNTEKNAKKLIWMHSDLAAEVNKVVNGKKIHEKNLNIIFKIYETVDKIVGCSHITMINNRKNLSNSNTYKKFKSAKNLIDIDRILSGAEELTIVDYNNKEYIISDSLELDKTALTKHTFTPMPDKKNINFVTIGRLSPEKNHENLICAFEKINKINSNTRLYIIGDGPLRDALRKLVKQLNLTGKVILTGNLTNPFSLMKLCNCFMLTSFYEGLPMVILEARTLGLPIIVSDFASVADSIYDNGQLIIGMEEDDIYNGMKAFLDGKVPNEFKFDPEKYNADALAEFEACLD